MRYISAELRKLAGVRYVWLCLAFLLWVNVFVCLYQTRSAAARIPDKVYQDFFALYETDPEQIEADKAELYAWQNGQTKERVRRAREGDTDWPGDPPPAPKYAPEGYSDLLMYWALSDQLQAVNEYHETPEAIIASARTNLREYELLGVPAGSYAVKNQERVIADYTHALENVHISMEYVHGWGEYFANGTVNLFIFAMLLVVDSVVFTQEMGSGYLFILRTTKHGRARTALAKLAAVMLFNVGIVFLFTASAWLVYGWRYGYSSAGNALQTLKAYLRSPYVVTIGQYFWITAGLRALAGAVFSAVLCAVSVFTYNYVLVYASGLGLFGLNYWFYTMRVNRADHILKNMNLIAAAEGTPLFARLRLTNLFGQPADFLSTLIGAYVLIVLAASALCVAKFAHSAGGVQFRALRAAWRRLCRRREARLAARRGGKLPVRSLSVARAEVYKIAFANRTWLIVLALLAVKVALSYNANQPSKLFTEAAYREYLTELAGPVTEEKLQTVRDEREDIETTIKNVAVLDGKYQSGQITREEYGEYQLHYEYAKSRQRLFTMIEDRAAYLEKRTAAGDEVWFVYDTGWLKLLNGGFDWTLYAVLLLLFGGSFSVEYDSRSSGGSFAQILRTYRHGRARTFWGKLLAAVGAAVLFSALWNGIDAAFVCTSYDLPLGGAPLASIEMFGEIGLPVTVAQFAWLVMGLRLAAAVLLAALITTMSCLLAKSLLTLTAAAALTLLPALLVSFGADFLAPVSYAAFLQATPMLMAGREAYLRFALVCAGLCVLLTAGAERKWDG